MKYTDQEAWEVLRIGMMQTMRPQVLALSAATMAMLTGDAERFSDYDSFANYLEEKLTLQGRKKLALAIAVGLKLNEELEDDV